MKVNFALWNSAIFRKVFIAFLALLVPLYAITLIFVNQERDRLREHLIASLENTILQQVSDFEAEADRIVRFQLEYALDKNLLELSTISGGLTHFERSQLVLNMQRSLYLLKQSSPFIEEVTAIIPSINGNIVSSSFEPGVNKELWEGLLAREQMIGPFQYWDNNLYLTLEHSRISFKSDKPPSYLLAVKMYEPAIRNMLSGVNMYPDSKSLLASLDTAVVLTGDSAFWQTTKEEHKKALQQELQQAGKQDIIHASVTLDDTSYFVAAVKLEELGMMMVSYVPNEQLLTPTKVYHFWFWAISALSFVIVVLFSLSIYRFIHRPLLKLIFAFRQVERGDIHTAKIMNYSNKDEFGYLHYRFNEMVNELRVLIEEVYEQQIRSQESELKRLQSQINPHFLYNSLFVLYQLIELRDNEKALRFANYLGKFFRYITRDSKHEAFLSREVEHARAYTEIQKICFGHRLHVDFERLPESCNNIVVPRVIIQPIIENAFKYAFEQKVSEGKLRVHYRCEEYLFMIIVEDNGQKLDEQTLERLQQKTSNQSSDPMELSGLINVHRRLQIHFGPDCGLRFSRSELGGLKIQIIVKQKKEGE